MATAAEADSTVPHRNSAHSAPPQTDFVKKTPPTTVMTTVTKALLAKSYQHQAKISPLPAGLGWFIPFFETDRPDESRKSDCARFGRELLHFPDPLLFFRLGKKTSFKRIPGQLDHMPGLQGQRPDALGPVF